MNAKLYLVIYDIGDPKRWRKVFRLLKGFGEWVQLSVFQCVLSARRKQELLGKLEPVIRKEEDHVLLVAVGPAEGVRLEIESLGRPFRKVEIGPRVL